MEKMIDVLYDGLGFSITPIKKGERIRNFLKMPKTKYKGDEYPAEMYNEIIEEYNEIAKRELPILNKIIEELKIKEPFWDKRTNKEKVDLYIHKSSYWDLFSQKGMHQLEEMAPNVSPEVMEKLLHYYWFQITMNHNITDEIDVVFVKENVMGVKIPNEFKGKFIGKGGKNIKRLEKIFKRRIKLL